MAVMTLKATQQDTVKAQLADILMHVSWGDISREYFGKSGSWLYHKLNGIDGNKKPTDFTLEERYQLKGALIDLSERILLITLIKSTQEEQIFPMSQLIIDARL